MINNYKLENDKSNFESEMINSPKETKRFL